MRTEQTQTFWPSVQYAFTSWWALFGLLAASITAFNLLCKLLAIGLSRVLHEIVTAYQTVVHIPVLALFSWLHWRLPPDWSIDLTVLWLLIGGVILRSTWPLRIHTLDGTGRFSVHSPFWKYLIEQRSALIPFLIISFMLWPIAGWHLLRRPHVLRYRSGSLVQPDPGKTPNPLAVPHCDLRQVLAVQALTLIAAISGWVVLNILLSQ